jgi:hypothetical protein
MKTTRNSDKSETDKNISKGGVHLLNIGGDLTVGKQLPIHLMISS